MTIAQAKKSGAKRVTRHAALRIMLACFLTGFTALIPVCGLAQTPDSSGEDPPSNEEFLRGSVRTLLGRTFHDFPVDKSKLLLLKAQEEHPANWLLEEEVVSYLLSSEYQVGSQSTQTKADLPESRSLFYRIIEMSLEYPKIDRKGFLGKRMVARKASLNLSFKLEDDEIGEVIWVGRGKDERSDRVKKSAVKSLNNESYAFLSPALPQDAQSRFVEPALVVAVVGGLIYLFFANR
jgi:hypothetical protein